VIDLHTHSTCSDGSDSPARVVELAATAGCSAIALTDHDGLSGLREASAAAAVHGIKLVPGCEVSCKFSPGTLHLLCYFSSEEDALAYSPLADQLERLRKDRVTRNDRLIERLTELGLPITLDEVEAEAGGSTIGRPHFATVLWKKGLAESYQSAFDNLLAKGGPAYIPKAFIDAPTTISAAKASGAVVVLGHPFSLGLADKYLENQVEEFKAAGLTGMECWYGRYSTEQRAELLSLAERHDLVPTGGSDYHGRYKPDLAVGIGTGDLRVPEEALDDLMARFVAS
jgi:predicted metal-dependent phosphoesterase TrpH